MDELKETSGGLFSQDTVPPEHHEDLLRITRDWPEEDRLPEIYW